eukprot:6172456-Pleurochrysis_carterae.AAC.3
MRRQKRRQTACALAVRVHERAHRPRALQARKIVAHNGLSDTVQLHQTTLEKFSLPPPFEKASGTRRT